MYRLAEAGVDRLQSMFTNLGRLLTIACKGTPPPLSPSVAPFGVVRLKIYRSTNIQTSYRTHLLVVIPCFSGTLPSTVEPLHSPTYMDVSTNNTQATTRDPRISILLRVR